MKRQFIIGALAFAGAASLAVPSIAQQQAAVPAAPAVEAGTYVVEPSHTRVTFGVSHLGFNDYFGEFTGASGSLVLDPRNPAASQLEVSVPTANITTTNTVLDGELRSDAWLDAAKYPALTFKSTKVTVTGPGRAVVSGNLTLHGVTRPVDLDATFNAAGMNPISKAYTAGFHVSGKIKRSDFGVNTYLPMIGDELENNLMLGYDRTRTGHRRNRSPGHRRNRRGPGAVLPPAAAR